MDRLVFVAVLLSAAGVSFYLWFNARLQNRSRHRLGRALAATDEAGELPEFDTAPLKTFSRRHWFLPFLAGGVAMAALWLLAGIRPIYSFTGGLVVLTLAWQLDAMLAERRVQKIESQLADAIDLMVGALRAGAGFKKALESALRESPPPLNRQLEEVVNRIELGASAQAVFRSLTERVPLETFLLFSSALSVHWEVGGSLAPTLATVGRTIRDRIELSRRSRAMTTQARVSIISVLCVTYFIALFMWFNDPGRMRGFLSTNVGSFLVAAAVTMQALGIAWSAYISRGRI
jgi:Flp pilus assembly protein TadB